jgi:hypothetical protein
MMNNYLKTYLVFGLILFLYSCKNYYNDTIEWMQELEIGTKMDAIQSNTPDYIVIDWSKPLYSNDEEVCYEISEIKGNTYDVLHMVHVLCFKDSIYIGFNSHK